MDDNLDTILYYLKSALKTSGAGYDDSELYGAFTGLEKELNSLRAEAAELSDLRSEVALLRELVDTLCERAGVSQY